jgi:hypothetical protein
MIGGTEERVEGGLSNTVNTYGGDPEIYEQQQIYMWGTIVSAMN